jgi:hypothetical protein
VSERYIVIPKWEDFQHYSDRDPIWIKVYTRLLSDEAFLDLTFHQRGVLVSLWIEYARSGRQLRDNTLTLTRQLVGRVSRRDIEALTYAGFITFSASKPLAQSKRREEKKPLRKSVNTLSSDKPKTQAPTEAGVVAAREARENAGWVDNLSKYTGCRYIRGEHSIHAAYDPLGTEIPPPDWPYQRPTKVEVAAALRSANGG